MVIFLCQLKNQPPIPRERYVFWCIQNTQKHGLTLTWTREPSEIAKSGSITILQTVTAHPKHLSTHMRGLFDQTCPRHGVCGQTTPPAAALPIPTHIQSQSCLGLNPVTRQRIFNAHKPKPDSNPNRPCERAAQHNEQLAHAQGTQHGSSSCTKSIHHAPTTPPCARDVDL